MKALILQMPVLAFLVGGLCASSVRADVESLPDGYVRLQCVNPGIAISQWVDTGYTPSSTDRIEMNVRFNVPWRTSSTALWNARDSNAKNSICLFWEGASDGRLSVRASCSSVGRC